MNWNFYYVNNDSLAIVVNEMNDALNKLSAPSAALAKCVYSNQHEGDARGVIFYPTTDRPGDIPLPQKITFQVETFEADHNDDIESLIILKIKAALDALTPEQAASSKVAFANYLHGAVSMSIWIPS